MIFNFLKIATISILLQMVEGIDAGEAINSLRQNNAVVGILYFIVVVEAAVIIKLWSMVTNLQKERIEDLKSRIKAEEDLRKEIQEVYARLNLEKRRK
jgi:tyrosyl-tRNA synthetase